MSVKKGDLVAIRGDLRMNYPKHGKQVCAYTDDQLIGGKYLKHTGHGGIWLGVIEEVRGDMARISNGWRGIERYEVMLTNEVQS